MSKPKSPRLTLQDANASTIQDLVDRLIDAPRVRAASIIRNLDRHKVDLALLSIVSSIDDRWRVGRKPVPLPESGEATERMRKAIADILTATPEAIIPTLLALSDATASHGERVNPASAPHTPPDRDAA